MMSRNKKIRSLCLASALLLVLLLPVFGLTGQSQSSQSSPEPAPQSVPNPNQGPHSISRQLVEQSREAAGEDDQAQFKHSPSVEFLSKFTGGNLEYAYWLAVVINFAIIAALIVWAWKKNLPAYFRTRSVSIQRAMEEARKQSAEANRRLAEVEARLSKLDVEINAIRSTAEKDVAAEEERIRSAAAEDARKVLQSAEQEIAAAGKAARRELKQFAAELAISLARKQIRVDASTDESLIQNFAEQLSSNRHGKN